MNTLAIVLQAPMELRLDRVGLNPPGDEDVVVDVADDLLDRLTRIAHEHGQAGRRTACISLGIAGHVDIAVLGRDADHLLGPRIS